MLYWGLYRDNGKENGNYYLGCRAYLEGQEDLASTLKRGIMGVYYMGYRGY